jgi:hypothetical protein
MLLKCFLAQNPCQGRIAIEFADPEMPPPERLKKSKQLTQSRKGTRKRKGEVLSLLCDLCVLCAFA